MFALKITDIILNNSYERSKECYSESDLAFYDSFLQTHFQILVCLVFSFSLELLQKSSALAQWLSGS